jgi:uncharacterized protein YjbJ (UPF0337 family)
MLACGECFDRVGGNRQCHPVIYLPGAIMNKDQVKGRAQEVKGKLKEVAGRISGNKNLEQEGKLQNVGGKVQAGYGDLKRDIKKDSA